MKNNQTLSIEKSSNIITELTATINNIIAASGNNKTRCYNSLRDVLPTEIKLGCGGSHIWAANQNNERLFIITAY
jgi:hypothetical protein